MFRLSLSSLRVRLILIVLMAVIPALGLIISTALEQRRTAAEEAKLDALRLTQLAAGNFGNFIEGGRQLLMALSISQIVQNQDAAKCNSHFAAILKQSPQYVNIAATDKAGNLFASAVPIGRPINFKDRIWFQMVVDARDFIVGEFLVARITGKPALTLAYPVLDHKGAISGTIYVGVDVTWFNQLAKEANLPAGSTLTMVDRSGTILARYPHPEKWVGKTMPEATHFKTIIQNKEGVAEIAGMDGGRRLYAFTSVHGAVDTGLYISIGISKEIAFKKINHALYRNLAILGAVAALALAAAWWGGNVLLLRPVRGLLTATNKLKNGDLSARTGLAAQPGELGRLARDFDEMVAALEQRSLEMQKAQEALRESEEKFRSFVETTDEWIWAIDAEGRHTYSNPAVKTILGYSPEEIVGKDSLAFMHEEDRQQVSAMLPKLMTDKCGWSGLVIRWRHLDGSYRYIESNSVPILGPNSELIGYRGTDRDITERKQAEESLRHAKQTYQELVENVNDIIYEADAQGIITYISPVIEQFTGYGAGEVVGQPISKFILPEQRPHLLNRFQSFAEGETGPAEYGIVTKSGAIKWARASSKPVIKDGQFVGIRGVLTDITERKQAEESLVQRSRQLEILSRAAQRLNAVLEIPVIMRKLVAAAIELVRAGGGAAGLMIGGKMVFTEYNDRGKLNPINYSFEKGYGVPGWVMDTMKPYITNDAEHDPQVIPEIQKALGFYNLADIPILDRQGKLLGCFEIHNTENCRPFDENDIFMLKGLAAGAAVALENAQLLVERRRAQEALGETTEKLRAVVQASPLAIIATNIEGKITMWNPASERMFGWTEREILENHIAPMVPEDQWQKRQEMRQRLLQGEIFVEDEAVRQRKDGTRVQVSIARAPLRDEQGKIVGGMAVITDITERKQLEAQLLQAQKMEAVGTLAGGIAHDFNNLLTAITVNVELAKAKVSQNKPVDPHLKEIEKVALRAAQLTSQLLSFSRRQLLQPVPLNLNDIITNLSNMLMRILGEHIELDFRLAGDLWMVKADPGHIEQVIMNLCVNARDAMPMGGRLTLKSQNIVLDEIYVKEYPEFKMGDYVVLEVADTGTGMDQVTLARIFEPFFTTKEVGKGTGLGLSMVFGIVKQHEGHVNVYSEPDMGTTFKIYLPRIEEPVMVKETPQIIKKIIGGRETILVAEDEDPLRQAIREMLESFGYTVLLARDGREAVEIYRLEGERIDLVLLDVVMPRLGGKDTADFIQKLNPRQKILFSSGYSAEGIHESFMIPAGMQFIQKPYTAEDLAQKVREVLEG